MLLLGQSIQSGMLKMVNRKLAVVAIPFICLQIIMMSLVFIKKNRNNFDVFVNLIKEISFYNQVKKKTRTDFRYLKKISKELLSIENKALITVLQKEDRSKC
jgi:hypothetical protein